MSVDDTNLRCFGCTPAEVLEAVEGPIERQGLVMVLMSLLSDVQEMVARGSSEDARQALNRAKLVIDHKLGRRAQKAAIGDVAPRVVVFASEGVTRDVAVQGIDKSVNCVVVDYDEAGERPTAAEKEKLEREALGCTREEFDKTASYIW